jgi:hypothetical protein
MRRDQGDEPGQLLDLARGLAQALRIILGVESGAGQRRAVDHVVEQPRQAGQDRDVDPVEGGFELAMVDMAHDSPLAPPA